MPVNRFDVPNTLVIPVVAVSLDSYPDALPCFFRIGIQVKAYLFFSQGPVKAFDSAYGLRMAERNTPMIYTHLRAGLSQEFEGGSMVLLAYP